MSKQFSMNEAGGVSVDLELEEEVRFSCVVRDEDGEIAMAMSSSGVSNEDQDEDQD